MLLNAATGSSSEAVLGGAAHGEGYDTPTVRTYLADHADAEAIPDVA